MGVIRDFITGLFQVAKGLVTLSGCLDSLSEKVERVERDLDVLSGKLSVIEKLLLGERGE